MAHIVCILVLDGSDNVKERGKSRIKLKKYHDKG